MASWINHEGETSRAGGAGARTDRRGEFVVEPVALGTEVLLRATLDEATTDEPFSARGLSCRSLAGDAE